MYTGRFVKLRAMVLDGGNCVAGQVSVYPHPIVCNPTALDGDPDKDEASHTHSLSLLYFSLKAAVQGKPRYSVLQPFPRRSTGCYLRHPRHLMYLC